jgi:hypothetical protein
VSEFWFDLNDVLYIVGISFLLSFFVLLVLSLLIPKKLIDVFLVLIFSIGFALYIQGNFINLDYGVLDGTEINWDNFGFSGTLNTIIWVLCVVVPLIIMKIWKKKAIKILKMISLIIVSVQVVTTGVLLLSVNTSKSDITVTDINQFSLSKDKNSIVFILDTFDSSYFNKIINEYPEYKEKLIGFTYFKNTLGTYPTTKGALPHILTNVRYDNSVPYSKYIESAYDETLQYDLLSSAGFDIGIYTSKIFLPTKHLELFSNIRKTTMKPSSYYGLGKLMYKAVAFSYFPHAMKKNFVYYSGDFNNYMRINSNIYNLYDFNQTSFCQKLVNEGLDFSNKKKAFRLYHLDGVHPPYNLKPDLSIDSNGTSEIDEALASLNVVCKFIDKLMEAGVYDRTSIIVMADHGAIDKNQNPLLLVKPEKSEKRFSVSTAPISFDDLQNTILYLCTGDNKYQPNVFSWDENDKRIRYYYYYRWDDSWDKEYLPNMFEYITDETAPNTMQIKKTGRVYAPTGIIEDFKVNIALGEKLVFGGNGEIEDAFIYGLSVPERTFTWSIGPKAKFVVYLEKKDLEDKDLVLSINFKYIYNQSQRIKCSVNGLFIDQKTVDDVSKPINFYFPASLIPESGQIQVEFEFPDATLNSNETRVLAFAFERMSFDYADKVLQYLNIQDKKVTIDFSEYGNSYAIINEGWYAQEPTHRWTSEEADIVFYTEKIQDYLLTVEYLTFKHSGDTQVLFNGKEVAVWKKNSSLHKESIVLPAELCNSNGIQTVTFITDNAKSPKETGENNDSRVLGIDVKSMTIEPYRSK